MGTLKDGSFRPSTMASSGTSALGAFALWQLPSGRSTEVVRPQWVGAMTPVGGEGPKRRWTRLRAAGKPLGTFDFSPYRTTASVRFDSQRRPSYPGRLTRGGQDPRVATVRVRREAHGGLKQRKLILSSVWALMFAVDKPLNVKDNMEGAHIVGSEVVSWASNITAKRRHGRSRLTPTEGTRSGSSTAPAVRARQQVPTGGHTEVSRDSVIAAMTREFERCAGLEPGSVKPVFTKVQLWGAANPLTAAGVPQFRSETRMGACGDWCQGPRRWRLRRRVLCAGGCHRGDVLSHHREARGRGQIGRREGEVGAVLGDAAALGAFPGTNVPSMGGCRGSRGGGGDGGAAGVGGGRGTWRREGGTTPAWRRPGGSRQEWSRCERRRHGCCCILSSWD